MHKVLLPGVSVLERSVARVRTRVQERLWRVLIRSLTPECQAQLDTLLHVPAGQRRSTLDRLRTGPTLRSAPELVRALRRLEEVRTLGLGVSVPARAPRGRVLELARFAATAKVSALERLAPERRMATLVAFVHTLEATAQDDALDLLEVLLTEIFSKAEELGRKARLRTLKDLDAAALQTSAACAVLLDPHVPDAQVRAVAFAGIPPDVLEAARQQIARLVRPPEDVSYQELQTQYRRVRRFLPTLLRAIPFGASPAGEPVREALQYLHGREERAPKGLPRRVKKPKRISSQGFIEPRPPRCWP